MRMLTTAVILLAAASAHAEDRPDMLTGADAIQAIVGKSLHLTTVGQIDSTTLSLYADGRAISSADKSSPGTWSIVDNKLCIAKPGATPNDTAKNTDCRAVTTEGERVKMVGAGIEFRGEITADAPAAP